MTQWAEMSLNNTNPWLMPVASDTPTHRFNHMVWTDDWTDEKSLVNGVPSIP